MNLINKLLDYEIVDINRQTQDPELILERKFDTLFKIFNITNIFTKKDFENYYSYKITRTMKNKVIKKFGNKSLITKTFLEIQN